MDVQVLRSYSNAAIENAEALIAEATLLLEHGHLAPTYFLAVAAIEECGKSLLAFDAQGRNLSDPAVVIRLVRAMNDHDSKIRSAFIGFLTADLRKNIEAAIDLIISLQHGREPAMYTDLRPDLSIRVPSAVVRQRAAADCVRLAKDLVGSARRHMTDTRPQQRTTADNQLFAMRSSQAKEIMSNEDFWWYYIAQLEAGNADFARAVTTYRADFVLKGRRFREPPSEVSNA